MVSPTSIQAYPPPPRPLPLEILNSCAEFSLPLLETSVWESPHLHFDSSPRTSRIAATTQGIHRASASHFSLTSSLIHPMRILPHLPCIPSHKRRREIPNYPAPHSPSPSWICTTLRFVQD
ncbi:hypothetical protein ACMFMF_000728 [Clarireedia jacksonii]